MKSNEPSTNPPFNTRLPAPNPWSELLPTAANWDAWIHELLTHLEQSQQAQQLVLLGEAEKYSSQKLKHVLTTGGQIMGFEASVQLRDFLRPMQQLTIQFLEGGCSSESYYEQVMSRMQIWMDRVLPTLEYISGLGPQALERLQHLQECLEQFRAHLYSGDWGRVIAGLTSYTRLVTHDLAFPAGWSLDPDSAWMTGLYDFMEPFFDQKRFLGGELIVVVHPIIAEHGPDWAMDVGTIYQMVRPLPELRKRWQRVVAANLDFENDNSNLGADYKLLKRAIQDLLVLVGDAKQSQCRTLLNDAEITVFGTGIFQQHLELSAPQHQRLLKITRDLLRKCADAVCLASAPSH